MSPANHLETHDSVRIESDFICSVFTLA